MKNMIFSKRRSRGMTVIEAGIVLAIIATLAGMGYMGYSRYKQSVIAKATKQIAEGIFNNVLDYSVANNGNMAGIASADCIEELSPPNSVFGGGAITCGVDGGDVAVTYPVSNAADGEKLAGELTISRFPGVVTVNGAYAAGNVTVTLRGS